MITDKKYSRGYSQLLVMQRQFERAHKKRVSDKFFENAERRKARAKEYYLSLKKAGRPIPQCKAILQIILGMQFVESYSGVCLLAKYGEFTYSVKKQTMSALIDEGILTKNFSPTLEAYEWFKKNKGYWDKYLGSIKPSCKTKMLIELNNIYEKDKKAAIWLKQKRDNEFAERLAAHNASLDALCVDGHIYDRRKREWRDETLFWHLICDRCGRPNPIKDYEDNDNYWPKVEEL